MKHLMLVAPLLSLLLSSPCICFRGLFLSLWSVRFCWRHLCYVQSYILKMTLKLTDINGVGGPVEQSPPVNSDGTRSPTLNHCLFSVEFGRVRQGWPVKLYYRFGLLFQEHQEVIQLFLIGNGTMVFLL